MSSRARILSGEPLSRRGFGVLSLPGDPFRMEKDTVCSKGRASRRSGRQRIQRMAKDTLEGDTAEFFLFSFLFPPDFVFLQEDRKVWAFHADLYSRFADVAARFFQGLHEEGFFHVRIGRLHELFLKRF